MSGGTAKTMIGSEREHEKQDVARASPAAAASPLAPLVDAVVDNAPALLRARMLLPAMDWRQASAAQVERLLQRLAEARMQLPAHLARDLVCAGHALGADATAKLPPELAALSALNAHADTAPLPEALQHSLTERASAAPLDPVIVKAIATSVTRRGATDLACRIALAQWPHAADVWRGLGAAGKAYVAALPEVRLRLAGFSTTELLAQALRPAFAARGLQAVVDVAPYGSAVAELMQPASPEADASPDALLIQLDAEALVGGDWRGGAAQVREAFERRLEDLCGALANRARQSQAPILVNTLPSAVAPALGHVDLIHAAGAAAMIRHANQRLAETAADLSNLHLVDADVALAVLSPDQRSEAKLWFYGRMAFTEAASRLIADAFAAAWQARRRGPVKVVALDFDNTLWGGVYGDDGIERLQCGDDFPGNAFKAFQQEALRLKAQGCVLVGLSKNNADAIDVFARHPGMVLRAEDLAASAINWDPKPDNIRRIASDLNLGLDSFLFLDDSPHERAAMRRMCPEVEVPELPDDPARRPQWLRTLARTWPLRVTAEDARRSDMYAAESKAKALRATAASYEDYLAGLEQRLEVAPLGPATLPRIAQLHERTNQFNLTTRRFTEGELASFMAQSAHYEVLLGEASDRFGSHGIVIAAVASIEGERARIDSFLMSCRVMSRTIETAFLCALVDRLAARGVRQIRADFLPTAKNGMVRDFYTANGFRPDGAAGEGQAHIWQAGENVIPGTPFVAVTWSKT